jgi:hypothetical protein
MMDPDDLISVVYDAVGDFSDVFALFADAYICGAALMIVFTIPGLSYTMSFMSMTVCSFAIGGAGAILAALGFEGSPIVCFF